MREDGFTLAEALCALALLGVAMVSIVPSLMGFMDGNALAADRSAAALAAERSLEGIRRADPAALPTSGTGTLVLVDVDGREFEVVPHYCDDTSLCTSDRRQVRVEVSFGGTPIYNLTTILVAW